jgi:Flp pilus assembly protein TadD
MSFSDLPKSKSTAQQMELGSGGNPEILLPPTLWFDPDPLVGQEELLKTLEASFLEGERVQVLQGPAGIGKTAVAIEYARRYQSNYQTILWARARTVETLVADFALLAEALQLPEAQSPYMSMTVGAVLTWLANHSDWLLILDDAHDQELVQPYATFSEKGHLLLTTRSTSGGSYGVGRTVYRLGAANGTRLLLHSSGMIVAGTSPDLIDPEIGKEAHRLVEALKGVPLALILAGTTIVRTGCTLADYWRRLNRLAPNPTATSASEILSVTIEIAIDALDKQMPAAVPLLRAAAFLHPGEIPTEILEEIANLLPRTLPERAGSRLDSTPLGRDPISTLLSEMWGWRLLRYHPSSETVYVSEAIQHRLGAVQDSAARQQPLLIAVQATELLFPDGSPETWSLCNRLLPHTLRLAEAIDQDAVTSPDASLLLSVVAYYLDVRGQVAAAEPLYRSALAIEEGRLGVDHPDLVTLLNNLALIYEAQNRDLDAERLLRRALSIKEKAFGLEDPSTLATLSNLAYLLQLQGEYHEAEELLTSALQIQERRHGFHHPAIVPFLEALADLQAAQWNYVQAESFCDRALAIREQSLGGDHPETARSLDKLAELYFAQAKNGAAELFFKRACTIRQNAFPQDHPDLALSYMQLADLYTSLHRYAEAEQHYARSYAIYARILGPVHPRTVKVQFNYDSLMLKIGK